MCHGRVVHGILGHASPTFRVRLKRSFAKQCMMASFPFSDNWVRRQMPTHIIRCSAQGTQPVAPSFFPIADAWLALLVKSSPFRMMIAHDQFLLATAQRKKKMATCVVTSLLLLSSPHYISVRCGPPQLLFVSSWRAIKFPSADPFAQGRRS